MRVASLVVIALLTAPGAFAETPTVNLDAQGLSLAQAVRSLSEQTGIEIVLDQSAGGSVTAELADIGLDQALDMLVKPHGLMWQKLWSQPDENGKIPVERIRAQVDALAVLADTPLVAFDPTTKRQTVFIRAESPAAEKSIDPAKLGLKAFYFIYKPKAPQAAEPQAEQPEEPAKTRFANVSTERMELFLKMTPEERQAAVQEDLVRVLNLPDAARAEVLRGMFGGMRNMDPQLREQFREAMRSVFGDRGEGRRWRRERQD